MATQIIARDSDTSITLDLLRALAAQVVLVVHILGLFALPRPALSFGAVAVLVFFVLSGFVIAHALMKAESFSGYAIDRFARIYSALIPAVLFIFLADSLMVWSGIYAEPGIMNFDAVTDALFLREAKVFGTGHTFWTLAIEFQMYIFVGALFFLKRNWLAMIIVALLFAKLPIQYLGDRGLFAFWLMGFGAYFVIRANILEKVPTFVLGLLSLAGFLYWLHKVQPGAEYNPTLYGWLGLAFVLLVAITTRTNVLSKLGGPVRFFAGYSYSLYLTHYTIAYAAGTLWPQSVTVAVLTFIVANVFAFGFAYVTERHYKKMANAMKSIGINGFRALTRTG
jgi:peptidoglycan/LPS O-acetylase OafA/YrhL